MMIIFAKYGDYDRRSFIETCLEKYNETLSETRLDGNVEVVSTENDKPYFKDYPEIRFSVSHSGDLVLLAMADTDVGIDVEFIRERDFDAIASRHFFEGERAQSDTLEGFLKVWTKKEAYLKLTGEGLRGLHNVDLSKPITHNGVPLVFVTLDMFEGYIGTVVAPEQPVIFIQLD